MRGTVIALKELAGMSQEMNHGFARESQELVDEVQTQLDAFSGFDDQQKRIQTLQDRIHIGREKIQMLSARVDVVRERIEGWERADREWQERTRKRLKIIWLIMLVMVFLIILLVVIAQYAPQGLDEAETRAANESVARLQNGSRQTDEGSWDVGEGNQASDRLQHLPNRTGAGMVLGGDDRLRALDEL